MRLRLLLAAAFAAICCAALAGAVLAKRENPRKVTVQLKNVNGNRVGTVTLVQPRSRGPVTLTARVRGLTPGFHGFHVHAVGDCTAPTFMTAGGHFKKEGQNHGGHAGDLPSLLVKRNGTATLRTTTDGFAIADVRDADGSAIVVHAGPDNFAGVPPRYAPDGPDQMTLDTGDSGARVACGPIPAAPGR